MENATQMWAPFVTWQFGVTCIAIVAVLQTLKNVINAIHEDAFKSKRAQSLLTSANVIIGACCAIPKGFLMGDAFGQRVFTGICAGFLSTFVYHILVKHLLPGSKVDADGNIAEGEVPPAPPATP